MKKILTILLIAAMTLAAVALSGCTQNTQPCETG